MALLRGNAYARMVVLALTQVTLEKYTSRVFPLASVYVISHLSQSLLLFLYSSAAPSSDTSTSLESYLNKR
jgi:hypothetical protein